MKRHFAWSCVGARYHFSAYYKGEIVGEGRVDILVAELLIVELKAVDALLPIHVAQVLSYLSASKLQLGLLINYKVIKLGLGIKRVIRS